MLMTDYKKRKKQYKYQNENKKNTSSTNNTTQKNTSSSTRQSSTRQSSARQTPNHSIARLDVVKNDLARVGEKMKAERESQNGTTLRSHYIANKNNLALPAYNASKSFANAKKQEEEQRRKQALDDRAKQLFTFNDGVDESTLERTGVSSDEVKNRYYDNVLPSTLINAGLSPYVSKIRSKKDIIDHNYQMADMEKKLALIQGKSEEEAQRIYDNYINHHTRTLSEIKEKPQDVAEPKQTLSKEAEEMRQQLLKSPMPQDQKEAYANRYGFSMDGTPLKKEQKQQPDLLVPESDKARLEDSRRKYFYSVRSDTGSHDSYVKNKPEYQKNLLSGASSDEFAEYYKNSDNSSVHNSQPFNAQNSRDYKQLNDDFNKYKSQMTKEEIAYYNYLSQKNEYDARNYAEMILPSLMQRGIEKENTNYNGLRQAYENAKAGFADSIDNSVKGAQTMLGIGNYWAENNPTEGQVMLNKVNNDAGTAQRFANNISRNIGNQLPNIALGTIGGAAAGTGLMGVSSYGDKYKQGVAQGLTEEKAKTAAFLNGLSEAGLQYFLGGIKGLSKGSGIVTKLAGMPQAQKAAQAISSATKNLVKNENVRIALKGIGRGLANAGDEALEEYLQEAVISPMIDSYTSGNPLKLNLTSPEAIEAAAIGFITAGILNAPTDVSNTVSDVRNNILEKKAIEMQAELEQKGRAMQAANDYIKNSRILPRPSYAPVLSENSSNTIRTNIENGMNEYNEGAKEKKRVSMPEYGIFAQRGVTEQTTPQINTQTEQTIPENQSLSTEQNRAVLDGLSANDLNVINNLSPEARQAVLNGRVTNKVLDEMIDAAYTSIQYNPELNKKYPATKSGGRQYARDIVANVNDLKSVPMSQIMANNMNPDNAKIYPNKTTKYSDDLNPANFKSEEAKAIIGKNANAEPQIAFDDHGDEIADAINNARKIKEQQRIEQEQAKEAKRLEKIKIENEKQGIIEGQLPLFPGRKKKVKQKNSPVEAETKLSDREKIENTSQFMPVSGDYVDIYKNKRMTPAQMLEYNLLDAGGAVTSFALKNNDTNSVQAYDHAKQSEAIANYNISRAQTDVFGNEKGRSINDILGDFFSANKKDSAAVEQQTERYLLFQKYMLNLQDKSRLNTEKEILRPESKLTDADMKLIEKENPDFRQKAMEVFNFFKNELQYEVDTGLISKETMEEYLNTRPLYLPAHREITTEERLKSMNRHSNVKGVDDLYESFKGSDRNIEPLHEQAQRLVMQNRKNGALNQVFNSLYDTYRKNNGDLSNHIRDVREAETKVWFDENDKKHVKEEKLPKFSMYFYKEGKKYIMEMDEYLYNGMQDIANGMGTVTVPGLNKATDFIKAVTTDYNIPFALEKNPIKDLQEASIHTEYPAEFQALYAKNLATFRTLRTNPKHASKMLEIYFAQGNADNTFVELRGDTKFLGKKDYSGASGKGKAALDTINKASWAFEQLCRFTEFEATMINNGLTEEVLKNRNLTADDLKIIRQASYNASKVTTNFKVSGKLIRFLNKNFAPYLNANIQGSMQYIRDFRNAKLNGNYINKGGNSTAARAGRLALKAAQYGGAVALVTLLNHFHQKDAEDDKEHWWNKISDYDKNRYLYFGEGFKVLKSETLQNITNIANVIKSINDGEDEVTVWENVKETLDGLIPNPLNSAITEPVRRIFKYNKTYYGADIDTAEDKQLRDGKVNGKERAENIANIYDENTTEFNKWLSKAFLSKLGIDPKQLDELFDAYTGGAGDFIMAAARKKTWNNGVVNGLEKTIFEPFTKHLFPDELKANKISEDYYLQYNQYENSSKDGSAVDKLSEKFFKSKGDKITELKVQYKAAENANNRYKQIDLKNQKEKIMLQQMEETPKYRAAAEKVLKDYPNFDYDSATTKEKELINLKINKEYGGVEYALKQDKTTWEKVQKAKNEHGISYDTSYKVYEYKKALPSDMKSSDQAKAMEKFFRKQVDNGSMTTGEANAAGDFYINNNQIIPKTNTYDFSSDEAMILSQKSVGGREKYEYTKNVFGNVSIDRYEELLDIYNKGTTKNEKIAYLMRDGKINQYSAELFHKIHSGSKGFKTTSVTSTLRDNLKVTTAWVEDAEEKYQSISKSNVKEEQAAKQSYLRQLVKTLPSSLRQQYTDDELYRYLNHYFSQLDYQ